MSTECQVKNLVRAMKKVFDSNTGKRMMFIPKRETRDTAERDARSRKRLGAHLVEPDDFAMNANGARV